MSDQKIRKPVEALELAAAQGYAIGAENEVIMNSAPALLLAMELSPHYAAEVLACMIHETYQPWWNEGGRQFITPQKRLVEL